MIDADSVAAVEAIVEDGRVRRPLYGSYCFSGIPATVQWLVTGDGAPGLPGSVVRGLTPPYERVLLILLDAFGWEFFERFGDDAPFLRRLALDGTVARLTTQFPATTAGHVTTIHTGLAVPDSGLYEWFIREPALDAVIAPLLFSFAGDDARDTLFAAGVDPHALLPFESLYRRLAEGGARSAVHQRVAYTPSTFSDVVLDGAEVHPFTTLAHALADVVRSLRAADAPAYSCLYVDTLDHTAHLHGPESDVFANEVEITLSALERLLLPRLPPGTLVLVTADHGQVPTEPADTIYLNRLWPGLADLLVENSNGPRIAPVGSARDCFLHVREGFVDEVVARLSELLGERASVERTSELVDRGVFGEPSPRLLERLAEVVVLPAAGEEVWWYEQGRFEQPFLGHHGGLSTAEALTFVATLVAG